MVNCRYLLMRLILFAVLLLAAILIPFFLFGERISQWIEGWLSTAHGRAATAAALTGILALDVLLPVPSSVVSTTAGALLGFVPGLAASFAGMTAGCLLGYSLGRNAPAERWLSPAENELVRKARERWGDWTLVVSRAVPVLAEASVVMAGASRAPLGRFLLMTGLSNLGISAIYAAAGAYSSSRDTFFLAFAAAIAAPGLAILLTRPGLRR
jgi:membrane protein DedA with SNARE-associated domain